MKLKINDRQLLTEKLKEIKLSATRMEREIEKVSSIVEAERLIDPLQDMVADLFMILASS